MVRLLCILALGLAQIGWGTPPKRRALIICHPTESYIGDTLIQRRCDDMVKLFANEKGCKDKWDVTVLTDPTLADLEEHFRQNRYPSHTPVFLNAHGSRYLKNDKAVTQVYEEKDSRVRAEQRKKDPKAKLKTELIETEKFLAVVDANIPKAAKWVMHCFPGGVCGPEKCTGATCLYFEPSGSADGEALDPATQKLIRLLCSDSDFKTADQNPQGGDGFLDEEELQAAICTPGSEYDIWAESYFPDKLEEFRKDYDQAFNPKFIKVFPVVRDGKEVATDGKKLMRLEIRRRCVKYRAAGRSFFNTPNFWGFQLPSPANQALPAAPEQKAASQPNH
jgi:hypothetical protein